MVLRTLLQLALAMHFAGAGALRQVAAPGTPLPFILIHQDGYGDASCKFAFFDVLGLYDTLEECGSAVADHNLTAFLYTFSGPFAKVCASTAAQVSPPDWSTWQAEITAGTPHTCPGGGWNVHVGQNFYAWPPGGRSAPTTAPPALPTVTPPPPPVSTPPALHVTPISAVGDPHLVNVHGQGFDLYQPGTHVLLQIPEAETPKNTLLRVEGSVERSQGRPCADAYFKAFHFTGKWAEPHFHPFHPRTGVMISVNASNEWSSWQHMGPVGLKVSWGHTNDGIEYLNLHLKNLGHVGYAIGGLLGNADHTAVSTRSSSCAKTIALFLGKKLGSVVEAKW